MLQQHGNSYSFYKIWPRSQIVPGGPQLAKQFYKERAVGLLWISEYNEIRGNKIADDLAKVGDWLLLMDPELPVGIYFTEGKEY